MPNRRTEIYSEVLEATKNLKPDFNLKSIMTYFELSPVKAFNNSFPRTANKGYFIRFTQSNWRKIQQNNDLSKRYEDLEFASNLKQLTALAFVPVVDVIQ
jgi:predicted adenine nucleotide alpha hydrolase (AANH) superfamily ATPase